MVRTTRWSPTPRYLPAKPLHRRGPAAEDGQYTLNETSAYQWEAPLLLGFTKYRDHGPHIHSASTVLAKTAPAEGPRRRSLARASAPQSAGRGDSKTFIGGGSIFGKCESRRFLPPPPKQVTHGGISGRPMTAADFRAYPPTALPVPLDLAGGPRLPKKREGKYGYGWRRGHRWESVEFFHLDYATSKTALTNEHMRRFTGHGLAGPSRHRRGSTTPIDRRVHDDPRAALRRSVSKLSAIAAFSSGLDGTSPPGSAAAGAPRPAPPSPLEPRDDPLLFDAPAPEGLAGRSLFEGIPLLDRVKRDGPF